MVMTRSGNTQADERGGKPSKGTQEDMRLRENKRADGVTADMAAEPAPGTVPVAAVNDVPPSVDLITRLAMPRTTGAGDGRVVTPTTR